MPAITRAFVVSERNGAWGKPKQVTGLAALTTDHFASVDTVSCPSVGNCSAGGSYAPGSTNHLQNREAFLVSEKNGVWGKAQNVAGLAKLNTGDKGGGSPGAGFYQISCSSAGNCLAAGSYERPERHSAVHGHRGTRHVGLGPGISPPHSVD